MFVTVYLFAKLCPMVCDSIDCSPPDPSVQVILQAKICEWSAIPFSREVLPFCISFLLGLFWLLPPLQQYQTPCIILLALKSTRLIIP